MLSDLQLTLVVVCVHSALGQLRIASCCLLLLIVLSGLISGLC